MNKMNIRKIIQEEVNDFDWVKGINATFTLEPNTIYLFEPNINEDEIDIIRRGLSEEYEDILAWLYEFPKGEHSHSPNNVKYFVTNDNNDLEGWCDVTNPIEFYVDGGYNVVDGRKYFNLG